MSPHIKSGAKILLIVAGGLALLQLLVRAYGTGKDVWDLLGDLLRVWGWFNLLSPDAVVLLGVFLGSALIYTYDGWSPLIRQIFGSTNQGHEGLADIRWESKLLRRSRYELVRVIRISNLGASADVSAKIKITDQNRTFRTYDGEFRNVLWLGHECRETVQINEGDYGDIECVQYLSDKQAALMTCVPDSGLNVFVANKRDGADAIRFSINLLVTSRPRNRTGPLEIRIVGDVEYEPLALRAKTKSIGGEDVEIDDEI